MGFTQRRVMLMGLPWPRRPTLVLAAPQTQPAQQLPDLERAAPLPILYKLNHFIAHLGRNPHPAHPPPLFFFNYSKSRVQKFYGKLSQISGLS